MVKGIVRTSYVSETAHGIVIPGIHNMPRCQDIPPLTSSSRLLPHYSQRRRHAQTVFGITELQTATAINHSAYLVILRAREPDVPEVVPSFALIRESGKVWQQYRPCRQRSPCPLRRIGKSAIDKNSFFSGEWTESTWFRHPTSRLEKIGRGVTASRLTLFDSAIRGDSDNRDMFIKLSFALQVTDAASALETVHHRHFEVHEN